MQWRQTHKWKNKDIMFPTVTMRAYQDRLNAGFTKYVKYVKFAACIDYLKYVEEFYTVMSVMVGTFPHT